MNEEKDTIEIKLTKAQWEYVIEMLTEYIDKLRGLRDSICVQYTEQEAQL